MVTVSSSAVHRPTILAIVVVAYFMVILDVSIVFTAVPAIQAELHLDAVALSWVQNAYTLTFGGLLLLAARAGDLLGRRLLFIGGLLLFTAASALVGFAPAAWWLIGARAVQGVGAAIVAPTSLALLTGTFREPRERGRAVALYAATAGIGASVGLVVGGVLTDAISWRAGFFVNLPVGAALILLTLRCLAPQPVARGRFDVAGALLATGGVGSLTFGVVQSSSDGWADPRAWVPTLIGPVLLVALVLREARAAQPILPLRLFRNRTRSGAYVVRFLYLAAMVGFFFFTTQYLQDALGFTALQAGIGFLPMTLVNFAVALNVPRILRQVPAGPTLVVGVVLTAIGMAWLSRATADADYVTAVALPMVLVGAGQGLAFAPLTSFGIHDVAAADAGAASGTLNTAHQLGSCLGLAALTALAASAASTTAELSDALTGAAAVLLLAALAALVTVLPGRRRMGGAAGPPDVSPSPSRSSRPTV